MVIFDDKEHSNINFGSTLFFNFEDIMIFVARKIFRKNFIAIAIFPFIFLKDKNLRQNKRLINHEKIHLRQQIELLVIPFYLWYLIEFLVRLIQYKNAKEAYFNISFEREAYENDENLDFLKNRKVFNFLQYLNIKS